MTYIMGIVIWVGLSWAVFIALILRFFYVSNPQRRDQELRNKVEANSPYNDGWTREFYKNN